MAHRHVDTPWTTAFVAVLSALLGLLLTACGPGVGGTGTGEEGQGLQAFGAEARAVCTGDLAPLLACPAPDPTAGGSGSASVAGTAPTWWASADGAVQLSLSGNALTLQAECGALEFRGLWGQAGTASPAYYGWLRADGDERVALLSVQRDGARLVATLIETDARVRLGPVASARLPAAGTLTCP